MEALVARQALAADQAIASRDERAALAEHQRLEELAARTKAEAERVAHTAEAVDAVADRIA